MDNILNDYVSKIRSSLDSALSDAIMTVIKLKLGIEYKTAEAVLRINVEPSSNLDNCVNILFDNVVLSRVYYELEDSRITIKVDYHESISRQTIHK